MFEILYGTVSDKIRVYLTFY